MTLKLIASAVAIAAMSGGAVMARDTVHITGSSTVLPYSMIVAEAFGENFDFPTPVVEGGGSGAGRAKLCEGVGTNTVDIANSSSRITQRDLDACAANGVTDVMEVRFGYDGIIFASDVNGPEFAFTQADIFNALAAQVAVNGVLVNNPHKKWSDFNSDLPAQDILVLSPGTKHGTREVFDERVILDGCKQSGAFDLFLAAAQGDDDHAKTRAANTDCTKLRTDGRNVDIDGDYTETLARLEADRKAIGVFGLSFFQNNTYKLRVGTMDGVIPTPASIAAGDYPVSRPLFFYVKAAHLDVIPGLHDYVAFFVSNDMAGPDGPLAQYGLVSDPALAATQEMVRNRTPMGALN